MTRGRRAVLSRCGQRQRIGRAEPVTAGCEGRFLIAAGRRTRVRNLIVATAHAASVHDEDAAVLVDVDLSILGADAQTYDRFECDVRKEYWWVPGPLFRQTRAKILQSFLDRPSVYATAHFRERLEQMAREDLGRAIGAMMHAS